MYCTVRACDHAERILNAGTQVISALQIFQEEVAPCLPPDYAPMDTFISAFEEELEAHIESKWGYCFLPTFSIVHYFLIIRIGQKRPISMILEKAIKDSWGWSDNNADEMEWEVFELFEEKFALFYPSTSSYCTPLPLLYALIHTYQCCRMRHDASHSSCPPSTLLLSDSFCLFSLHTYPLQSTPIHFNQLFCPLFPSSLPFYHFLVNNYSPFFPCHSVLVEQPSELEVVEMLQLIDWLEYFQEQMRVFGYDESSLKCMARFPVIAEDLLR